MVVYQENDIKSERAKKRTTLVISLQKRTVKRASPLKKKLTDHYKIDKVWEERRMVQKSDAEDIYRGRFDCYGSA